MLLSVVLPFAALGVLANAFPSKHGTSHHAHKALAPRASDNATATTTSSSAASTCSGNTAADRSSWCDYDLTTDYYTEVPDTGVTREYWLQLVNTTLAADGYERDVLTVNGTIPGPTLFADWGDNVIVHVDNALTNNGSSIHFHGIRQNMTNPQDGVSSITQCPIAPGDSYTYKWRAEQYGSTWYHSHFALQAWEGVFGGIVINGPASSNYDNDAGVLFLNDWSHETVDALYSSSLTSGPPTLDNGLINGTNVYGDDNSTDQTGSRFAMAVTDGESYRLRLVNGAIDTHFKFSIDNHTMTVMSTDLVPIEPYTTDVLNIAIGQRYDIVVNANQSDIATDFWMRAIPQLACSVNANPTNIKGIFHYGNSTSDAGTPTTTGYSYTDACVDEDMSNLVPIVSQTAGNALYSDDEEVSIAETDEDWFLWYMNATTFVGEWNDPTLYQIYNNDTSFTTSEHAIKLPDPDVWVYVVIQAANGVSHPIHLHGHDYLILAQGTGTYSSNTTTLLTTNPPRRDTATLDADGYLVIAFKTDNPGAWLMHCHIGWHTSEGLALQFIERESEIPGLFDTYDAGTVLSDTCTAWEAYATKDDLVETDSGI